jgi:SpoVK/Ycf46/Vps4 family AAA+-type ATPase
MRSPALVSETHRGSNSELFELELELPNKRLTDIAGGLIGFAERHARMKAMLRLLLDRDGLETWSKKHYGKRIPLIEVVSDRYPLAVFHGDVGTGKTATAEASSNALARELNRDATLFKLSTRVRGSGSVGQMSTLINQAFEVVIHEAGKSKLAFLIIDEADSLAASRAQEQSHHEDKVAVNTLIQKIDDVRRMDGRVLVFLCTNRFEALDPAILRRAAHIEKFERPDDREREQLFRMDCEGMDIDARTLQELVKLTGPLSARELGFTFSDLRTRLLPEALGQAYPDRKLQGQDLVEAAKRLVPSPSIIRVADRR